MPLDIIHKSDSAFGTAPFASDVAFGEVGVNYNANNPGLFLKDTSGAIRRIAGVWFGTTAPLNPTNGTFWYDENPTTEGLKMFRNGDWRFTTPVNDQRSLIVLNTLLIATASYTFNTAEPINLVEMTSASPNSVIIPTHAAQPFPRWTQFMVLQSGTGVTTITPSGGVTINATPGLQIAGQHGVAVLLKRQDNVWNAFGDLAAP
jgi:hypothetical protein